MLYRSLMVTKRIHRSNLVKTVKRCCGGMRRAIAAMVESGNNVIIDDIILSSEFLDDYLDVFSHLDVTFVGVQCPLNVIENRESARPGRFPGTAAGHFSICHSHGIYDVCRRYFKR